ncbi:hypothetical protein D3C81_1811700 [compost metagenome]
MVQEVRTDMIDKWTVVREQMPQRPGGGHANRQRHRHLYHQLTLRADLLVRPPQPEYRDQQGHDVNQILRHKFGKHNHPLR